MMSDGQQGVRILLHLTVTNMFTTKNEAAHTRVSNHARTIHIHNTPVHKKRTKYYPLKETQQVVLTPVPDQTRHPDHGAMEDCSRRQKMSACRQRLCKFIHAAWKDRQGRKMKLGMVTKPMILSPLASTIIMTLKDIESCCSGRLRPGRSGTKREYYHHKYSCQFGMLLRKLMSSC